MHADLDELYEDRDLSQTGALRRLEVPVGLLPELNAYGGWFGRNARPGDTHAAFVGEELASTDDPRWPPLFWGRTGGFLIRTLRAVGVDMHSCYFTNAIKPGGANPARLKEELDGVMADHVVALGNKASALLDQAKVTHVKVPHPSWVLRFHHKDRAKYAEAMRRALS